MHPEEIKAALRIKGVTLSSLADELQMSRAAVTGVIAGTSTSRRVKARIAEILGKPLSEIWAPKSPKARLRRTRAEIAAQRGSAAIATI